MVKRDRLINICIITIAILLAAQIYFWPIVGILFLSTNTNISLIILLVSIIFRMRGLKKGVYALFILLLLFSFNIVHIYLPAFTGDETETSFFVGIGALSFNGVGVLMLVVFATIHKKVILSDFKNILYGSEIEQIAQAEKRITFYYDKFSSFTADELAMAFKMFNDYPLDARVALERINQERELNLI